MIPFLAAHILAALSLAVGPCTDATPVDAGEVAPCTGIIMPDAWTLKCVECVRVDLPLCTRNLIACETMIETQEAHILEMHSVADDAVTTLSETVCPEPPPLPQGSPWWHVPLTVIVSLAVGAGAVWGLR